MVNLTVFHLFSLLIVFCSTPILSDNCWWSGCQPNTWAQRGCSSMGNYREIGREPCPGGDKYHCCPNDENSNSGGGNSNSGGGNSGGGNAAAAGNTMHYQGKN